MFKRIKGSLQCCINEVNQVSPPNPEFDEAKYEIWDSRMKIHLQDQGYDVCQSCVFRDTSMDESRRYNPKSMNFIFSALPDPIKSKFYQCS